MPRAHVHEEHFACEPEALFRLLVTPSAIRSWWGAASAIVIAEAGGSWSAAWGEEEDRPDYATAATISRFEPPHRLTLADYRYRSADGPLPFEAPFEADFVVERRPDGATLRVTQDGFPDGHEADDFLDACRVGWTNTFHGIRSYLADKGLTGHRQPPSRHHNAISEK